MTPHLNRLFETVQIRGHNTGFLQNSQKLSLIITKYSLLSRTLKLALDFSPGSLAKVAFHRKHSGVTDWTADAQAKNGLLCDLFLLHTDPFTNHLRMGQPDRSMIETAKVSTYVKQIWNNRTAGKLIIA